MINKNYNNYSFGAHTHSHQIRSSIGTVQNLVNSHFDTSTFPLATGVTVHNQSKTLVNKSIIAGGKKVPTTLCVLAVRNS